MYLGQEFRITDWFIIHFTENPGMAFGMELGGSYGKPLLTIFRIIVVGGIFYWLTKLSRQGIRSIGLIAVALIFAGALGNIIDSLLYGIFFESSYQQVADFLPAGGGYASFLHGKVVDMFYFPLYKGYLPDWLPIWGGDYFVFFRPIFNIADVAISTGVGLLLLFQKEVFRN